MVIRLLDPMVLHCSFPRSFISYSSSSFAFIISIILMWLVTITKHVPIPLSILLNIQNGRLDDGMGTCFVVVCQHDQTIHINDHNEQKFTYLFDVQKMIGMVPCKAFGDKKMSIHLYHTLGNCFNPYKSYFNPHPCFFQLAQNIFLTFLHKSIRMVHKNVFFQVSIQKCNLHIHFVYLQVHDSSNGEYTFNGNGFGTRGECLLEININNLWVPFCHQLHLVMHNLIGAYHFIQNTYLHPMILQSLGRGINSHVLSTMNDSSSFCMAFFHLITWSLCKVQQCVLDHWKTPYLHFSIWLMQNVILQSFSKQLVHPYRLSLFIIGVIFHVCIWNYFLIMTICIFFGYWNFKYAMTY